MALRVTCSQQAGKQTRLCISMRRSSCRSMGCRAQGFGLPVGWFAQLERLEGLRSAVALGGRGEVRGVDAAGEEAGEKPIPGVSAARNRVANHIVVDLGGGKKRGAVESTAGGEVG